jgi:hypothetical protein
MAHGYYLMTGKAQAVMLHTNVGLSNGATGAINAACEQIPMLLMSGRTPVTEGWTVSARAPSPSAGARKCATRRRWCANPANGTTN